MSLTSRCVDHGLVITLYKHSASATTARRVGDVLDLGLVITLDKHSALSTTAGRVGDVLDFEVC